MKSYIKEHESASFVEKVAYKTYIFLSSIIVYNNENNYYNDIVTTGLAGKNCMEESRNIF